LLTAKSCADGADRRSFLAGDARAEAEHRASERLPLTIRRQWEATIVLRGELRLQCDRAVETSRPPPAAAIAEHQRALAAKVPGVMTVNCYECAIGLLITRSPLTEVLFARCPLWIDLAWLSWISGRHRGRSAAFLLSVVR